MLLSCYLLMLVASLVTAGPTLYKLDGDMAEEIKIPVSSTGMYHYLGSLGHLCEGGGGSALHF